MRFTTGSRRQDREVVLTVAPIDMEQQQQKTSVKILIRTNVDIEISCEINDTFSKKQSVQKHSNLSW
jgi:hypothetical protein